MVAVSLKQSGLITDRAYSQLTAADEAALTRNALKYLLLLVQRNLNSYSSFIEAAQALCSRAMKTTISRDLEQNKSAGKTKKQQKQQTSDKNSSEKLEKLSIVNDDVESDSAGLTYFLFHFFSFCS